MRTKAIWADGEDVYKRHTEASKQAAVGEQSRSRQLQHTRESRVVWPVLLTREAGWPIPCPSKAPNTPTVFLSLRISAVFTCSRHETGEKSNHNTKHASRPY